MTSETLAAPPLPQYYLRRLSVPEARRAAYSPAATSTPLSPSFTPRRAAAALLPSNPISVQGSLVTMAEKGAAIGLSWAPKVPMPSNGKDSSSKSHISPQSSLWKSDGELVDGLFVPPTDPKKLNKLMRKNVKDTAGQSWFDMHAPTITPELKKDLELLKLRNVIDPKRHFKKGDNKSKALPKYFQVGTVVEDPSEFYGRLTKKERKQTFAQELLADENLKAYRKRKIHEIEEKNRPGGVQKWKRKGRQTFKSAKQRRG